MKIKGMTGKIKHCFLSEPLVSIWFQASTPERASVITGLVNSFHFWNMLPLSLCTSDSLLSTHTLESPKCS